MKFSRHFVALIMLACLGAYGCNKLESDDSEKSIVPVAAPPPTYTKADWVSAISAVFTVVNPEENTDGTTKSLACFGELEDCKNMAFARHDPFNKLRVFVPTGSQLYESMPQYLQTQIVLPDCGDPIYVLRPIYFSNNRWLHINRFGILADGELILDQSVADLPKDLESGRGWYQEKVSYIVTQQQRDALRKIAVANKISVRITGERGYVMLEEHFVDSVRRDTIEGLEIFDLLSQASASKQPAVCE